MAIDLRSAINAISDVVQNRPQPIREFDQIYMKAGDIVVHSEFVSRQFDGKSVVFVGDGDAIGLCLAHLLRQGILERGPSRILILDFDERMVNSVQKFARTYEMSDLIDARLYNVSDPLPDDLVQSFEAFHVNPPWGQYNQGESVKVFMERGMQSLADEGWGCCVIADDDERIWTGLVLAEVQKHAIESGMVLKEMLPGLHTYHLDDAPDLTSCTMLYRLVNPKLVANNLPLSKERRENFYGRDQGVEIHFVRERPRLNPSAAPSNSYEFELIEGGKE
jgi:predicted methyltransferase